MNILKKLSKAYKNLQIHWYIWYLKYSENGCTMIKCIKMRLELWLRIDEIPSGFSMEQRALEKNPRIDVRWICSALKQRFNQIL